MHPGGIGVALALDDLVRGVPVALGGPPQRGERRHKAVFGRCVRERGFEVGHSKVSHVHHHFGGVKRGAALPGSPAMFTVTVKMSLRYISTGSAPPFSPMPKAADGVAGVRIAFTPLAKTTSKSFLISLRTFLARR